MISVVLPCRDEEKGIVKCIERIKEVFSSYNINGEIIVVDNSSRDGSARIAEEMGARVVREEMMGYGYAYKKGFSEAKGNIIVMGDADTTYDFSEIPLLLKKLDEGYDIVIGSRLKGKMQRGAMPFLNRYIGNPALNLIFNLLYKTKLSDTHSGFRVFRKEILQKLNLCRGDFMLALEMLARAKKAGLKMAEVPISYYTREGVSKLRPLKDGFKHLAFMLKEKLKMKK